MGQEPYRICVSNVLVLLVLVWQHDKEADETLRPWTGMVFYLLLRVALGVIRLCFSKAIVRLALLRIGHETRQISLARRR